MIIVHKHQNIVLKVICVLQQGFSNFLMARAPKQDDPYPEIYTLHNNIYTHTTQKFLNGNIF